MSWAKLSDDFADDCWTLSDAAFRLHVEGLTWNGRKLLDCIIPKSDVRRFAKHPEAVAELLAVEWWADRGDSYEIRHHATYQRLKKDVLKQQETSRANGAKGGRPKNPRERVETQKGTHAGNPAGSETHAGNPVANQNGQDRTGIYEEVPFQENLNKETGELEDDNPWKNHPVKSEPEDKDSGPDLIDQLRSFGSAS